MNIPVRKYWRLLVGYLAGLRVPVFVLAALLLGTIALQLAKPQILKSFIDAARDGSPTELLLNVALLFIGAAVIEQALQIGSVYLSEHVGWSATNALRLDLARHALNLDQRFHHSHTPGELIERIDGDVTALANFFSQFVLRVLGNLLLLGGITLLLFREHWLVGAAIAALSAATFGLLNYARVRSIPYWVAGRQASADLAAFFEERLAGVEDIRANGATAYKMRMLYRLMRVLYERYRAAHAFANVIVNSSTYLQTAALVVGIGLGAALFLRGELTLGSVFLISSYARLLAWPLREIVRQAEDLQRAEASIERVDELFATPITIVDGPGAALSAGPLSVSFDDLRFAYHSDKPVLQGLSFCLPAGQTLGLLGRTGSGKTTLTRLLFRFYDPTGGGIRLNDVDIRSLRLAELRRQIGLVTQDVQLFRGSIRDNLTLFDPAVPDRALLEAIEALGLTDWFRVFPQGLDTVLPSGGGGLSAGEAQLLAFTRVFLKNPGLVILDEASSRLDPATERLIERAVDRLIHNRTGIIIAHRLQTLQRVDQVLILEGGRVSEAGDRAALAADPRSRFAGLLRTGLEEALA